MSPHPQSGGGRARRRAPALSAGDVAAETLRERLAAALLGELHGAARERVLADAAAQLSRQALSQDRRLLRRPRPRAAGRSAAQSPRARDALLPVDDRSAAGMPRYRVIVERRSGATTSRFEFSICAPSARGAVAAQLRDGNVCASAANEAKPADRFSWSPGGSCQCTGAALAGQARGGELDDEGRCGECGLQVLPPVGASAGRRARRGGAALRRLRAVVRRGGTL